MVKRKQKGPSLEELLERPWCYYCERDFDDRKVLADHQKAKHFKCERCNRRLNTIGGLVVHMRQVHKEEHKAIENSLPGRNDVTLEIFGMEGVPQDLLDMHRQRVVESYYKALEDRRLATGNPPAGDKSTDHPPAKKMKAETPGDLKARLAARLAQKAAEKEGATAGVSPSPVPSGLQSPAQPPEANSVSLPHVQSGYLPNASSPPPGFGNGFAPPMPPFSPTYGFDTSGRPFSQQGGGMFQPPQTFAGSTQALPYVPQGQPSPFSHQGQPPHFPPQSHFPSTTGSPFHAKPPANTRPAQSENKLNPLPPTSTGSALSPVPGLPQRPSFNPPAMSKEDMGRLHSGAHAPPGHAPHVAHIPPHPSPPPMGAQGSWDKKSISPQPTTTSPEQQQQQQQQQRPSDYIDEIISNATGVNKQSMSLQDAVSTLAPSSERAGGTPEITNQSTDESKPTAIQVNDEAATPTSVSKKDKKSRKDKKSKENLIQLIKPSKLSIEEARARHSPYVFKRAELDMHENQTVLDEVGGAVTGTVRGEDNSAKDSQDAH